MTNKKTTKDSAPKRTRGQKAANQKPAEEHPAMRGEQLAIGVDETPHDKELDEWGRELKRAQGNWAAWGRSATVLTEKIDTRMQSKGIKHYYSKGVELRAKATDPKTKIEVVIHDPTPAPSKA